MKTINLTKKKKVLAVVIGVIVIICALMPFVINGIVITAANNFILTEKEAKGLDADCVLVLGAGLQEDGSLSNMLNDRMLEGIALYNLDAGKRILASGDHERDDYDEVNAMKSFALKNGVPQDDIFLDHAGLSTYESMYRARDIFECKKVVIVTQKYHLYRAVYIARALGLEAYGVAGDKRIYQKVIKNNIREMLARNKDFVKCIKKPLPTHMGKVIPISGDAKLSDERNY